MPKRDVQDENFLTGYVKAMTEIDNSELANKQEVLEYLSDSSGLTFKDLKNIPSALKFKHLFKK